MIQKYWEILFMFQVAFLVFYQTFHTFLEITPPGKKESNFLSSSSFLKEVTSCPPDFHATPDCKDLSDMPSFCKKFIVICNHAH